MHIHKLRTFHFFLKSGADLKQWLLNLHQVNIQLCVTKPHYQVILVQRLSITVTAQLPPQIPLFTRIEFAMSSAPHYRTLIIIMTSFGSSSLLHLCNMASFGSSSLSHPCNMASFGSSSLSRLCNTASFSHQTVFKPISQPDQSGSRKSCSSNKIVPRSACCQSRLCSGFALVDALFVKWGD